jgi:hypothetical protein
MYAGWHADYLVLQLPSASGTLSTGDARGASPNRPVPDNGAAPASQSAAAGGQARPRGRRFSDRSRAAGARRAVPGAAVGQPDAPAALPRGEALDAISLTGGDTPVAAGPAADEVAGAKTVPLPDERTAAGAVTRVSGPAWPMPAGRPAAGGPAAHGAERSRLGGILPVRPVVTAGSVPVTESGQEAATPPIFLLDASRAALAWARRRHLGLSSACGISVALAGCAAVWFSAGTTLGIVRGVGALWASYLILAAGRALAGQEAGLAGLTAGYRRQAAPAAWLAALGSAFAETIVYLGLVIGAAAQHWPSTWKLGITVLGLVAVRNVMTACSIPYGLSERPVGRTARVAAAVVTMAAGGRILVIGVVAPIWGARTALLVIVAWAISSIGYGLAGRAAASVAPEGRAGPGGGPADSRMADPGGGPPDSARTDPAGAGPDVASATLRRLRDDGALARGLGALVRGNVLPLPPALLGLAAVSALAALGLHGLPGALTIGPAIVLLLAAPGSANPHAGRLDWLVPVLLVGAQVLYLTAAGEGARVPGPVIFALVAALLVRYAELASPGRPVFLTRPRRHLRWGREYGTELGWEGRVLFAGLTAAMGIATIGYLALTAYLVLLVGAKAVRSCLTADDDLR